MPFVKLPGGGVAHVKMQRRPVRTCSVCGTSGAEIQCDGAPPPKSKRKTCNVWLCTKCAEHHAPNIDYCPKHALRILGVLL